MIFIAIYHCSIKIVSRSKGKSAVASAAYRSGEKLKNEYDGVIHDYTRKKGIAYTEIMLPSHAPPEFSDRSTLWNSVEKIEKSKNSQLAREIEIAIPKELERTEQISLVREFVKENFVDEGMCTDIAIHDKDDGNPHAHILLTMRPLEQDGSWGAKSKKEYILDKNGERIVLKSGNFKTQKVDTVDWNSKEKAELWRSKWEEISNRYLEKNSCEERIDHRSFARQGKDEIPTVHLGTAASQMEQKGIQTERGNINRDIRKRNALIAEIKAKILSLKEWIAGLFEKKKESDIPDSIADILLKKSKANQNRWQKLFHLKDVSQAIAYLQEHNIVTQAQLDEQADKIYKAHSAVRKEFDDISHKLKTKRELFSQYEIYLRYKPIYEQYSSKMKLLKQSFYDKHRSELMMYQDAEHYIQTNAHGKISLNKLKEEISELDGKYKKLYVKNQALTEENNLLMSIQVNVKEAARQADTPERNRKRNKEIER